MITISRHYKNESFTGKHRLNQEMLSGENNSLKTFADHTIFSIFADPKF